jgi:hypothetical protein
VDWNFFLRKNLFCSFTILSGVFSSLHLLCISIFFFISWLEAEVSNAEILLFYIRPTLHLAALVSARSRICYSRVSRQEYLLRFCCVRFTMPKFIYQRRGRHRFGVVFFSFLALRWIVLNPVPFKMAQDELFGFTTFSLCILCLVYCFEVYPKNNAVFRRDSARLFLLMDTIFLSITYSVHDWAVNICI